MKRWYIVVSVILLMFPLTPFKVHAQTLTPEITSQAGLVIDSENGQVLYKENEDELIEVGSISKLLAVYVVLKAVANDSSLTNDSIVPISDVAYSLSQNYDISNVPLRQDYNYTVNELVEAIAVGLANGATIALAEFISENEAEFVTLMEEQLEHWGITDYHFINATGLPANVDSGETNALSAEAAAVTAYHLVKDFPQFLDYSQQTISIFKPQTDDAFNMNNYNQMLRNKPYEYEGVRGLIAGSAPSSGGSFVSYVEQGEFGVISVVLGGEEDYGQYEDSERLLDYVYSAYMKELVVSEGQETTQVGTIAIEGSEATNAELIYGEDMSLVVPIIDTTPRLDYQFIPNEDMLNDNNRLEAPIDQGVAVGMMTIKGIGTTVEFLPSTKGNNVPIILAQAIEEAPWHLKAWRSVSHNVNSAWEATRSFFVDLFN